MRIAIDLNDVVRDYSNNFIKYYVDYYNHTFDLDGFELTTNELNLLLPFPSDRAYHKFIYEDYSYELYAKCPVCTRGLENEINELIDKTIPDLDLDEKVEVMFVSPFEYGLSIGCTYSFLAKLGTYVREVFMPKDSMMIWDKCDVLITANPALISGKPDGKTCIKIKTDYNKECEGADYTFSSLSSFLKKENNIEELLKHDEK